MAPKSGNKRAAQVSKQPAKIQKKAEEKKIEEFPQDPHLDGLVTAIRGAELPEDCKEMLLLMLPCSFTTPVEQRHEIQEMVVCMVGKVIEQMHGQMIKDVQEATITLEAAQGKKTNFEATVLEAESQLTAAVEIVHSKEACFVDATNLENEKATLFDSAKEVQTKGDVEFQAVKDEKDAYATSVTNSFRMLQESNLEGGESLHHFQIIQPFISKLALDDSLILALPSTCQKKPCDRGSFDKVIMEQLGKALQTHIANLEKTIEAGVSAGSQRAAAVRAAEEELNAAKAVKANAQEALSTAQTKSKEASDFLEASKLAVTDINVELGTLGKAHEDKVAVSTNFENWNLSCFRELRDKSAAPQQETPPQEMPATKAMVVDDVSNAPVSQAGA